MIGSYLSYRLRAGNRHGLHSPFVYGLMDKVIGSSGARAEEPIEALRTTLLKSTKRLQIDDYGAGSRVSKSAERTVGEIARSSASRPADAAMLQRLVDHLGLRKLIELGSNLGLTTAYLAAAACRPELHSIEGDASLAAMAREHLRALGLDATVHQGAFKHILPEVLERCGQVDLVYLDGHHTREATLGYYAQVLPYCHDDTVLAVGDIHWSKDMEMAWQELRQDAQVSLSIDLFYMGLLFFRKGVPKQHFILKHP